jgi:hypothetical protein
MSTKMTSLALENSTVDSSPIGQTTPEPGTFTTLKGTITASTINDTPIGQTTPEPGTFTTLIGAITGSTVDDTIIGQTTPEAGTFTTLKGNTVAGSDNSTNAATTAWVRTFLAVAPSSGFVQLAGGLIIQWGTTPSFDTGPESITFPLTFPNACWQVIICDNNGSSSRRIFSSGSVSSSGFSAMNDGNGLGNWIAVGY